jgi:uncharacterized membrane protein YbaN (DUF454 family)
MGEYTWVVMMGVSFGFLTRLVLLKRDYRQYPTYPHGTIIHLALGFIAAGLGAIAVPALSNSEYAAITFLALAAQQFREVRNMERNTLNELDSMELVSRGKTYIEGIAMAFEGRNYLVILTAFMTSLVFLVITWWAALLTGLLMMGFCYLFKRGKQLKHLCKVQEENIRFEGANLFVGDIHIMNIGLEHTRKLILAHGLGFVLTAHSTDSMITLSNLGQRQAILHDLAVGLGIYRDAGNPSLVPLTRRNIDDGRVAVFCLPQIKDAHKGKEIISLVPVLENSVRVPSQSEATQHH